MSEGECGCGSKMTETVCLRPIYDPGGGVSTSVEGSSRTENVDPSLDKGDLDWSRLPVEPVPGTRVFLSPTRP